ncbi:MAG: hypothetical protein MJY54_00975 [archaeon]|nr:hypothetical protein [archaeon]
MELKLIEETEDSIKIGLINADTTLIMPIIEELNTYKDVKVVRFIEEHPELIMPAIYVKMYKGSAKDAVIKAALSLSEYYSTISQ